MRKLLVSKIFLIFILYSDLSYGHIAERGKIFASAGGFLNRTIDTPKSKSSSNFFGPGLLVEADINSKIGLELALFYMEKAYYLPKNGVVLIQKVNRMHLPLGIRYWPSRKLGFGLAFYSAYRSGAVSDVERPAEFSDSEVTSAVKDIADYGFDFSIQTELFQHEGYTLLTDFRYSHSITSEKNESANQGILYIGIKRETE